MSPSEITKINLKPHLQELHDLLSLLYLMPEASAPIVDYHQANLQKVIEKLPKNYLVDLDSIEF